MNITATRYGRGLGRYLGPLQVEVLTSPPGVTRVRLLSDFIYVTHRGMRIVIPRGFTYDGASIPSILWAKLGHPLEWRNVFGLPHDYLYRTGLIPDRNECDMIAWDAALLFGHDEESARDIYAGLALFGQSAWDANARKRAECGDDREKLYAYV